MQCGKKTKLNAWIRHKSAWVCFELCVYECECGCECGCVVYCMLRIRDVANERELDQNSTQFHPLDAIHKTSKPLALEFLLYMYI